MYFQFLTYGLLHPVWLSALGFCSFKMDIYQYSCFTYLYGVCGMWGWPAWGPVVSHLLAFVDVIWVHASEKSMEIFPIVLQLSCCLGLIHYYKRTCSVWFKFFELHWGFFFSSVVQGMVKWSESLTSLMTVTHFTSPCPEPLRKKKNNPQCNSKNLNHTLRVFFFSPSVVQGMVYFDKCSSVPLKKICFLLFLGRVVYICQLNPISWFWCSVLLSPCVC